MSDTNFSQLLDATFDHGNVHFKILEKLLKSLIFKLDLNNVSVNEKFHSSKNDIMLKSIPSTNTLKQELCKDESNPVENMINVVNLTKRVEALEKTVQKLASLIQSVMSEQRKREEDSIELSDEIVNKNDLISKEFESPLLIGHQIDPNVSKCTQNVIENSNQFKGSKKGWEKCCQNVLQELLSTQTLPKCPFNRLEKSCRKKQTEIQPDDKFSNLCDLRELERHLKEQNDTVFSLINSNQFYLQKKICCIEKLLGKVEGQIEDLFFACEQNDEKIDDTISSMNDFNSKIFCLKSDVKSLLDDSREFKMKSNEMDEKFETMNIVKANKLYVDGQLKLNLDIMFEELTKTIKIKEYEHFVDGIRMRLCVHDENFKKFQDDVKKSMICFIAKLDEKLDKQELKTFKNLVGNLFEDFVKDLKTLLFNISQNALSMGASQCLQTNLNCIACNSKVSMATEFPQLENSSLSFKNKLFRVKTPKKSLKSSIHCADMKSLFKVTEKKKKLSRCHQSMIQFPPRSQQCFIISKDNSIFQSDPLKCLLNSK